MSAPSVISVTFTSVIPEYFELSFSNVLNNVFVSEISYDTAITENVFYVDELQVDGEDALGIYEKKDDSLVWYCTIPEDFNDIGVDPFDSLVYTELDFKMPDSAYESLELAKELAVLQIRVNAIAPGSVLAPVFMPEKAMNY